MNIKNKAYLSIFGVFTSGLIVGGLSVMLYIKSKVENIQSLRNSKGFEKYIFANLEVNQLKQDSLRNLLNKSYQEISELRNSTSMKYHIILDSLNSRLALNLDSTQIVLLKKNTSKLHEMVKQSLETSKEISQSNSNKEKLISNSILEKNNLVSNKIIPIPKHNYLDSQNQKKDHYNLKENKVKTNQQVFKKDTIINNIKADSTKINLNNDEDETSNEKGGARHIREIINQLNPTKNQLVQINSILINAKNDLIELKRNNSDLPFIFKRKRKVILRETNMKVLQILNEDQKTKYKSLSNSFRNNTIRNGETGVKQNP